jgi:DNA-binding MarR family transcriptional regulator
MEHEHVPQQERGAREAPSAAANGPVSHQLFRVVRLHRMLAGYLLRDLGLHRGQELLLMHLWDSGPVRQTELIEVLDSDSPTMTRMVQRLEKAGLVERVPDPTDGRASLVSTTKASEALRLEVEHMWHDLEVATVGDLTDAVLSPMLTALAQVETNLANAVARVRPWP